MRRLYLVLLPMGFSLPTLLPKSRCALTAPFHPYLKGGLFSVALSLKSPWPAINRHRVSVEPGLSSLQKKSGCPTVCRAVLMGLRQKVKQTGMALGIGHTVHLVRAKVTLESGGYFFCHIIIMA